VGHGICLSRIPQFLLLLFEFGFFFLSILGDCSSLKRKFVWRFINEGVVPHKWPFESHQELQYR
jgi:hypothetical protein